MKSRIAAAIAAIVVSCVALTACTSAPSATSDELGTPMVSRDLTLEELREALPADAFEQTANGALATAKYFVESIPRALESGDFSVWDALALPTCEGCAQIRESISGFFEKEAAFRAAPTVIDPSEDVYDQLPDGSALTEFKAREADVFVTYPGQDEQLEYRAADHIYNIHLEFIDGAWRIVSMKVGEERG